jgi:hypothetical protein
MDPNKALEKIRELIREVYNDKRDFHTVPEAAIELADTINSLDAWLISGGFLPDAWKPLP